MGLLLDKMVSQAALELAVCVGKDLCLSVGFGKEKSWGLGFTGTLDLFTLSFMASSVFAFVGVSGVFPLLFFTALNSREKRKGQNISVVRFCTRFWESGLMILASYLKAQTLVLC